MSYQVIARKWRPKTFEEVVGQDHIVQTLKNAISIDRIAHAYLFSGSRGVGKTSTARIFARALNCKSGPSPSPCNKCDYCLEILDSRSLDVIEIDGASNNSVDDVRELRESVKYAPAKTKFKVYIIDEVHMLSKSAFNALLKTLEEPPAHLIFIFATTELNKIPDTILSRCQYFDFKQIGSDDMVKQLELIVKSEGIEISLNGLKQIACAAEGSLRDAEGMLDQVISYCGDNIRDDQIASILGMAGQELLRTVTDRIIDHDTEGLLTVYQEIVRKGQDTKLFCRELQEYFRNLTIAKLSGDPKKLIDLQDEDILFLKNQAKRIGIEEIQYLFNTLLKIEYDLRISPAPALVLEMALVRMSRYQPVQLLEDILKKLPDVLNQQSTIPTRQNDPVLKKNEQEEEHCQSGVWEETLKRVIEKKPIFSLMLAGSEMVHLDETVIRIGIRDKMTLERLKIPENIVLIREAVREILGSMREIQLEHIKWEERAEDSIQKKKDQESPIDEKPKEISEIREQSNPKIVQDALEVFGGTILK